jgi:hypothetical protein
MSLAQNASLTQVRAIALDRLRRLLDQPGAVRDVADQAHHRLLADDVNRFLAQGIDRLPPAAPPPPPPGAPIGDTGLDYLLGLDGCLLP